MFWPGKVSLHGFVNARSASPFVLSTTGRIVLCLDLEQELLGFAILLRHDDLFLLRRSFDQGGEVLVRLFDPVLRGRDHLFAVLQYFTLQKVSGSRLDGTSWNAGSKGAMKTYGVLQFPFVPIPRR